MIVDIHNHILPEMDDGARNDQDVLLMLADAAAEGITHIIATPHHGDGKFSQDTYDLLRKVEYVNALAREKGLPVKVVQGMEIHLYGNLFKERRDKIIALAGKKYLLIEFPDYQVPPFAEEAFYLMQLRGFIPIIAHAERNQEVQSSPEKLFELVRKGALVQITASSVTGDNGRKLQKTSGLLLKHRLVHFIASDAHDSVRRPIGLRRAYSYIEEAWSKETVSYLKENAVHVLEGKDFCPQEPIMFPREKYWKILQK